MSNALFYMKGFDYHIGSLIDLIQRAGAVYEVRALPSEGPLQPRSILAVNLVVFPDPEAFKAQFARAEATAEEFDARPEMSDMQFYEKFMAPGHVKQGCSSCGIPQVALA